MTVDLIHDDRESRSTVEIVIAGWTFFRFFHDEPHARPREKRAEQCAREVAHKYGVVVDVYSTSNGWHKLPPEGT